MAFHLDQLIRPRFRFPVRVAVHASAFPLEHPFQSRMQPLGVLQQPGYELPHSRFHVIGSVVFPVRTVAVAVVTLSASVVVATLWRVAARHGGGLHVPSARGAAKDTAGQFPESSSILRGSFVVLQNPARGVYPLSRYPRLGYGHGDPIVGGLRCALDAAPVASLRSVGGALRDLRYGGPLTVKPPDAIALGLVQPSRDFRRHQRFDLVVGVRLVNVVKDAATDERLTPDAFTGRRGHPLALEGKPDPMKADPFHAYHVEDALDYPHLLFVYYVVVACGVVLETKVGSSNRDYLSFARST